MSVKKIFLMFISFLALSLLGACNPFDNTLEEANNKLQEENNALREELAAVQSQGNKITDTSTDKLESQEKETQTFEEVNLGDSVSLDFAEITFDSASWSDEIKPTDTSGVYSYMADREGESFFWVTGTLKNLSGEKYNVENTHAEIVFDNKYKYTAYLNADDGGNDFYGYNVNPLKTVKYYIYASCPDEIKETYSTAAVNFAFMNNFDYERSSDWEDYDNRFVITLSK